jgi:palmitoyltransferase
MVLLSSGFYVLHLPFLEPPLQIPSGLLFTGMLVLTLSLGLICTLADNSDPTVQTERDAMALNGVFDSESYSKQCPICRTHVLEKTKHCVECGRCTQDFDHHCKWLNNCIGVHNYRVFAGLITALQLMLSNLTAAGVLTAVQALTDGAARDNIRRVFGGEELLGYYIASLMVTGLAGVLGVLNAHLLVFHIYLKAKGISTYEFILARRERTGRVADVTGQTYQVRGFPDKMYTEESSVKVPNSPAGLEAEGRSMLSAGAAAEPC